MTNRPALAFAALEDRAHDAAQTVFPDLISLRDHVVEIEIGAFQQERGVTQRVRFNLVAELSAAPRTAAAFDDVDAILSYDVLVEAIEDTLSEARFNLLETLAEGVAARVLLQKGVARVFLRVEKLDRCSGALGVEITRTQPKMQPAGDALSLQDTARVLVVSQTSLEAEGFAGWLLAELGDQAAILCVSVAPEHMVDGLPVPVARRIDLLTMEQAAWHLAALDSRFVVVASRTELDWGLRNGQVSVWAPSKLVVDAREDAPESPLTMPTLAQWLSRQMELGPVEQVLLRGETFSLASLEATGGSV